MSELRRPGVTGRLLRPAGSTCGTAAAGVPQPHQQVLHEVPPLPGQLVHRVVGVPPLPLHPLGQARKVAGGRLKRMDDPLTLLGRQVVDVHGASVGTACARCPGGGKSVEL